MSIKEILAFTVVSGCIFVLDIQLDNTIITTYNAMIV